MIPRGPAGAPCLPWGHAFFAPNALESKFRRLPACVIVTRGRLDRSRITSGLQERVRPDRAGTRRRGEGKTMNKPMLTIAVACALAGSLIAPAPAQEWPQRPLRLIVSFGPGGGAD